jgi:hypothetical protein
LIDAVAGTQYKQLSPTVMNVPSHLIFGSRKEDEDSRTVNSLE